MKKWKGMLLAVIVCMLALLGNPAAAKASEYRTITDKRTRIGSTEVWLVKEKNYSIGKLYVKKGTDRSGRGIANEVPGAVTNGKIIYYLAKDAKSYFTGYALYSYTVQSGKSKIIPIREGLSISNLLGLYNGKLILEGTGEDTPEDSVDIYAYEIKTKRTSPILKDCAVEFIYNQYIVGSAPTGALTEVSLSVYNMKTAKKKVIQKVWRICQSGSKFYYIKTAGRSGQKKVFQVWVYWLNSGKTKAVSRKFDSPYAMPYINRFTEHQLQYTGADGKKHTLNYSTGAKPTSSITLNRSSATLVLDGTNSVKLSATLKNLSGTVAWSSSNNSVATVDKTGKVTGKKEGTAVITAKVGKYTAKCKITVRKRTQNEKATAAYRKLLETGKFDSIGGKGAAQGFYVLDLDGDGVKELIFCREKQAYIYGYVKNRTVKIAQYSSPSSLTLKFYKSSRVLWHDEGGSGVFVETIDRSRNGKQSRIAEHGFQIDAGDNYRLNGRTVGKAEYEAYEKKVCKGDAVELSNGLGGPESGYWRNTAANRNKYCR